MRRRVIFAAALVAACVDPGASRPAAAGAADGDGPPSDASSTIHGVGPVDAAGVTLDPEGIYLDDGNPDCDDAQPGTQSVPNCTYGAAVAFTSGGEPLYLAGGPYDAFSVPEGDAHGGYDSSWARDLDRPTTLYTNLSFDSVSEVVRSGLHLHYSAYSTTGSDVQIVRVFAGSATFLDCVFEIGLVSITPVWKQIFYLEEGTSLRVERSVVRNRPAGDSFGVWGEGQNHIVLRDNDWHLGVNAHWAIGLVAWDADEIEVTRNTYHGATAAYGVQAIDVLVAASVVVRDNVVAAGRVTAPQSAPTGLPWRRFFNGGIVCEDCLDVTLEGNTVRAPTVPGWSAGVWLHGENDRAVLRENTIVGGPAATSAVLLMVDDAALYDNTVLASEVASNSDEVWGLHVAPGMSVLVDGGSIGCADVPGVNNGRCAGLYASQAGDVTVRNARLHGGAASISMGVWLQSQVGDVVIEDSVLEGGIGGGCRGFIASFAGSATATFSRSTVVGGAGCVDAAAIDLSGPPARLSVLSSIIDGGSASGPTRGILQAGASNVVVNSVIYGGDGGTTSVGASLGGPSSVAHSVLLGGHAPTTTGLSLGAGAKVLVNNVFEAGSGTTSATGLAVAGTASVVLRNNAFWDRGGAFTAYADPNLQTADIAAINTCDAGSVCVSYGDNVMGDFVFADPEALDFHLTASAGPLNDAGIVFDWTGSGAPDPGDVVSYDIDGDLRSGMPDIGIDEVP